MKSIYRKYFTKVSLMWAGCLILLVLVYIFMLVPQKRTKKQVASQLVEKKQMYNSIQKLVLEENRLKLNQEIEHLQSKLNGFMAASNSSSNLTLDISQIANNKNIYSFSIKPRDSRKGSKTSNWEYLSENYIDVNFTASFNQFATFLNALERHRPVIFIDKFKIIRSKESDSDNKIDMTLAVFAAKRRSS